MAKEVFIECFVMVIALVGFVSSDSEKQLDVVISYETEHDPSTFFFTKLLNRQLFDRLNKCGVIRWRFMPCTTSSMANGVLVCRGGDCQCAADKIHACAATLYKDNQEELGKFVMCYFASKNAKNCANSNGMCYDTIETCVKEKKGDKYCNDFFDIVINDWQTIFVPGIKFGSKYDKDVNYKATGDFKGVLCEKLKSNNLQCDVCSCS
ncbi:uncharacterized protein LOC135842956 [Planococcus citri]|uniref:uncharacterized protein LOC135842956 n=1 Tax=Planococcus citri TaxID=170843 RepID=UPI0031F8AD00